MSRLNKELLRQTMDHILGHQEQWYQGTWGLKSECGTAFCFAGWAVQIAGKELMWSDPTDAGDQFAYVPDPQGGAMNIGEVAEDLLGLDSQSADALFAGDNTLEQLKYTVDVLCDRGRITHAQATRIRNQQPDPLG